jgi:TonB family protein
MFDPVLDWPAERLTLRGPVVVSAAFHVLLACLFLVLHMDERLTQPSGSPESPILGFFGPRHPGSHLEIPLPDALHFYFYQPPRAGVAGGALESRRASAGDFALRQPAPPAVRRRSQATPVADGALAAPHEPRPRPSGFPGQSQGAEMGPPPAALPALQPDITFSEDFVIVKFVKPIYPEAALQRRVSANVVIAMHVSGDGDIDDVHVERAESSPAGSTAAFELTALDALRQWRIRPPLDRKTSQGWWFTVPIEYRPEDKDFLRLQGMQGMRPLGAPPPTR